MSLRSHVEARPLGSFVGLAFGFTWLFWFSALFLYPSTLPPTQRAPGQLLLIVGSFGPFVAAAVVARLAGRWDEFTARLFRWRVGARWYLLVVLLPFATFVLAYGVHLLLGGPALDLDGALPLTALPGFFAMTLLVGGGNEEPGWRGFALEELEVRYGPLAGTALLGALWTLWHLPAFLDPASVQNTVPLLAWVIGVFANTVVLTWLVNHTGSVLVAAIYHALFNVVGTWPATAMPLDAFGRLFWIAVLLYSGFVLVLLLATRGTLGYQPASHRPDARASSPSLDD